MKGLICVERMVNGKLEILPLETNLASKSGMAVSH